MEIKENKSNRQEERPLNNGFTGRTNWLPRVFISLGQALVVSVLLSGPVAADSVGSSGSTANIVTGDVLNIEGETYTIKDKSGHEVPLRVNGQTKHEDRIKVGDKVQAQVGPDGVAQSIRIQLPDDGMVPRNDGVAPRMP